MSLDAIRADRNTHISSTRSFIPGLHPLLQLQLDPEMDTLVPTSTITTLVLVLHTPFNSNSGTIPSQHRETMMIMSTHTPRIFGGFTRCPVIFVVDIVLQNAGRMVDSSRKLLTVDDLDRNMRRNNFQVGRK